MTDERLEDEIDLGGVTRKFRRHWILLALGALVGGAAGLIWATTRPVVYEAVTSLLVKTTSPGVPWTARPLIENHVQVGEMLAETGLDKPPSNMTAQGFMRDALQIEEMRGANLVKIRVTLNNASRAADACNILARKALALNIRLTTEEGAATREQLRVQVDESNERVKASAQQLLAFQSKAQIEVLRKDTDAILAGRGDLPRLLIDIETEKARLAAAELELRTPMPPQVTQTSLIAVANSRTRLAALERQRQEMAVVHRIGQTQFKELSELYSRQIELARLQGAHDLAKRINSDLTARLAQAKIDARGSLLLQIADEAAAPERPVPTRPVQSAGLGFAIGLLAGMVAALIRGSGNKPVTA